MKKIDIKKWIKEHKKEIIIAAVAAGGTALCFLAKEKKVGIRANGRFDLNMRFLSGGDYEDEFGFRRKSNFHSHISLNNPDLTVDDLGKLGDLLKDQIPSILGNDVKMDLISVTYDKYIKKEGN